MICIADDSDDDDSCFSQPRRPLPAILECKETSSWSVFFLGKAKPVVRLMAWFFLLRRPSSFFRHRHTAGERQIYRREMAAIASTPRMRCLYIFNRDGVCLHYHVWLRPLTTLSPHQDQKLMFGLLFSLKSFTAKMDPVGFAFFPLAFHVFVCSYQYSLLLIFPCKSLQ